MLALLIVPASLCLADCNSSQTTTSPVGFGNAHLGAQLIGQEECGTCHEIPGVAGADGHVGPPLDHMAERTIIAGMLPNTPDNMLTWLENPQAVVPGNAMPNMELNSDEAKDIAAYLYTLR
jgi:cytochrome c2